MRTGNDKNSDSYIPVCHAESSVCFEYPANRFVGTTFGSASVEVTRLSASTEKACLDPGNDLLSGEADAKSQLHSSPPTILIDAVPFRHTLDSGAAMSHKIDFTKYRGFDKGRCYELAAAVTYTNFAVYDSGQIKEFTARDEARVTDQLNTIISSFRALK